MSGNIYPFGQCTWWCADREPWCMRYGNLGNGLDWAAHWRAHGGFVTMSPAVTDIACFQPGADGADAVFGHVAVVVGVLDDAHFTVSEMNGPAGRGHTDDRVCHLGPGVSFLVQSSPQPPQPPPPLKGEPVFIAQNPQQGDYLVFDNGLSSPIGASATVSEMVAKLKVEVVNVDAEFIVGLKAIVAAKP